MPSLLTKSVPWSFKRKRELLPKEALLTSGIPEYDERVPSKYSGIFTCPYQSLLEGRPRKGRRTGKGSGKALTEAEIRQLVGNGVSLVVVGTALGIGLVSFRRIA